MSYCSGYSSRKQVEHDLLREWTSNDRTSRCLKHVWRGLVMWSVWEIEDLTNGNKERIIRCDAVNRHKDGQFVDWGYRPMTEEDGPNYETCPISFFDDVPDPGGYATEWRARCRERARRTSKAGAKVGDVMKLNPGCNPPGIVVISTKPFRGTWDGNRYRIQRRHLNGQWTAVNEWLKKFESKFGFNPLTDHFMGMGFVPTEGIDRYVAGWTAIYEDLMGQTEPYVGRPPKESWDGFAQSYRVMWKALDDEINAHGYLFSRRAALLEIYAKHKAKEEAKAEAAAKAVAQAVPGVA